MEVLNILIIPQNLSIVNGFHENFGISWRIISNVYGEPGEVRTLDPVIKSHVLYLLSYRLVFGGTSRI